MSRSTPASEYRLLVDHADRIAERILGIEAPLAPWLGHDALVEVAAWQTLCTRERRIQVGDREIDVIRVWPGIEIVAVGARIKARQDGAFTIKVMSSRADAVAGLFEQMGIETRGRFDI